MSLSSQFQNLDAFIFIKGTFIFQQVLRWKMKNNNSDAKQKNPKLATCCDPLQRKFLSKHINHFTISFNPSCGLLFLRAFVQLTEKAQKPGPAQAWLMRG